MVSPEQLRFAQKYPFTATAKNAIKSLDVSLGKISEDVRERAVLRVQNALSRKPYAYRIFGEDRELLENEVLSFPVAKIIVSLLEVPFAAERFAESVSDSALEFLRSADNPLDEATALSSELKVKFDLDEETRFLVQLQSFLSIPFRHASLKLINRDVEKGKVFLEQEAFALFLSEKAFALVLESLPVQGQGFPPWLKEAALSISKQYTKKRRASFGRISGRVRAEFFPPCMEALYADLQRGKNLPHMARFTLTTFLNAAGMPQEEIVRAFSSAPNYSERITRYQVKKICSLKGRGYSPPTCAKLKSAGLCNASCSVKSPMQFYRRGFFKGKRENGKKK